MPQTLTRDSAPGQVGIATRALTRVHGVAGTLSNAPTAKEMVTAYVRARLREMLHPDGIRGQTTSEVAVGKIVGVSSAYINLIKNGKRGVGESEDGFARLFSGGSIDKLRADSKAWAQQHPDELPRTVEMDERYPNRGIAADFARKAGLPEQAIQNVGRWALQSSVDPSALQWLDWIKAETARLTSGIDYGEPIPEEDIEAMTPGPPRAAKPPTRSSDSRPPSIPPPARDPAKRR